MRIGTVGFVVALLGATGCHAEGAAGRGAQDGAPTAPPIAVATIVVHPIEQHAMVRLVAVVEPQRRTAVGSKLLARVLEVRAQEGDRVRKGSTLVVLDARDLSAKRLQASAAVTAANAQAKVASADAERARSLGESGAISTAQVEAASGGATASNANAALAAAALGELDVSRQDSTVVAPFDGIVVRKATETGSFSGPGQPLLVLEDDSTLRVLAPIAARYAERLRAGTSYAIAFSSGQQASGVLSAIVPSGEPRAPGLVAELRVANADHALRAGVVANVSIPAGDAKRAAFVVPARAIVRRGGLTGVFVVKDRTLHLVWCSIDATPTERDVQVLDGLMDNDAVVRDASFPELRDGRRVTEGS